MNNAAVNVLLVEDNLGDARLLREALAEAGAERFRLAHVDRLSEALNVLAQGGVDVVLLDLSLPDEQGLRTVTRTRAAAPNVPIVVLTGLDDEDFAVKAVREGAEDYLVKGQIGGHLLARCLRYAVERHRLLGERKRAEEALLVSREYALNIIDSSLDMIIASDNDQRIVEFNPAALKAFGYRLEEVYHKHISMLYANPMEGALVHQETMDDGYCVREVLNVRKNGEIFSCLLSACSLRNARGEAVGVMGISRDITERKQAEEALRKSEERFAKAFRSSPVGICITTVTEDRFLDVNDAFLTITGFAKDEVTGRTSNELGIWVEPDDRRKLVEVLLRRGQVKDYDLRFRRKSGEIGHSLRSLELVELGGQQFILTFFHDTTERVRAEAQIRKLAAFPHFNPNPVLEFSATGGLNYFNDAAMAMARALGHEHPLEILPPGTVGIVAECLATRQSNLRLETTTNKRTLSWSFFPINELGVVHCYAGDVTERQNLEEQLRQSQKMESVGKLAGGVAHDFNNMLTVIQGNAQLLKQRQRLEPRQAESVELIAQAADRAANLTRQLLTFSRQQVIQLKNQNLNEIVTQMTEMLQRILGEDMTFEVRYASHLPPVHADRGMLEQVLMNLVVNSRDAMPKGGRLVVSTSARQIDSAYARQHPDATPGPCVCLSVSDTGCGIPPDCLPHIFEPFFTTKEVGKGTGLGLATVYGIVKQHKGWIEVQSEVGRGTTFTVYLPASVQEDKRTEAPPPDTAPLRGTETILVVEDEEPVRTLVRAVLEQYGYRVIEADSGVAAISVWEQHRSSVDLVLTDLVMPGGVNGRELADKLHESRPDLKVIFTSGYSPGMAGGNFKFMESLSFLQKPYLPQTLARAVRERLDAPA
ncbi:MAG: PAS domain S-box protein [Verrucomicrobiota bacterium]